MAKREKTGDYYDTLRAKFSGKEERADARAIQFTAPGDPADRYFGARPAESEPRAKALFDATGVTAQKQRLAEQIEANAQAKITVTAQAVRLLISLVWLGAAVWFFLTGPGGAAPGDSKALSALFAMIGGAGAFAALYVIVIALATGRLGVKRIRDGAAVLGGDIAAQLRTLEDSDAKKEGRAAIEANAFLRGLDFADRAMTGPAEADAKTAFAEYLARGKQDGARSDVQNSARSGKPQNGAVVFVIAVVAACAVGLAAGAGVSLEPPAIAAYPAALWAIITGGALYLFAGILTAGLFGASMIAKTRQRGEAAAFSAVTAALSASRAPAPADIMRRFGAADISPPPVHAPSFDQTVEEARSRGADSSDRLFDSAPDSARISFQAAPKSFRVDAFSKKIERDRK
ncbi:MAG: hypothetical protein AAGD92_12715 [Pseudomonadota bacterium]